ncbi:beta strand repeat-containing protein [Tenacibaculum jejuense]|uniref:Putative Conserved repeat domain protein n=1 Tax=Tenacibaculum jejuense TaxID=584609 RepID=A0A238UCN0_9FLAO|nr:DUF11 domain-containing protein [Tenacibaculum jejuense]SNR16328.1 putative Conserved repeat domain protein [Tenacibaculum jejuense]
MKKKLLFLFAAFTLLFGFSQEEQNQTQVKYKVQKFSKETRESLNPDATVKKGISETPPNNLMARRRPDVTFAERRLPVGGINLRGNITFVGNNILNRDYQDFTRYTRSATTRRFTDRCGNRYRDFTYTATSQNIDANVPHPNNAAGDDLYIVSFVNGCGRAFFTSLNDAQFNNGDYFMDYIDIDDIEGITGNADTFSSSKSTLNLPDCSRVVHASLYWAAVFPYETWETENARPGDYRDIKFKLPGQPYQDITSDEVLYDSGIATQRPYVCYKDVTSMVQGLSNPNGDYFAGNIRATTGWDRNNGLGGSAGWVMVIVYENETESSKNISLFDGFATIDGSNAATVNFTGFNTIPSGPVRAQFLTAALEGDNFISGDNFQIRNTAGAQVNVSTPTTNPVNNFFNGSITQYDAHTTSRNPDSENTLGFDVDLFNVDNPLNINIGNNQSSLDATFTTGGDVYWPFLNVFAIEIIEPVIQLVKTVDDNAGNDLAGATVGLGGDLWYNVSFQNTGTDDAVNTTIRDILPRNVNLVPADVITPPGVTLAGYDPPSSLNGFRGVLTFEVDDSLVEEGGAVHNIRFHVQVVTDCSLLTDVCSNIVENVAEASYDGRTGGVSVSLSPSVSGIDACNFGIAGSTNFLVDIASCNNFTQNVSLCGATVDLTAGAGFANYEWRDDSGNIIASGDEASTRTITVSATGTYTVTKTNPSGSPSACVPFDETFEVGPFGSGTNPIIPSADRVVTCVNDTTLELAEIYLCGSADSRTIPTGVGSPTTVRWQVLTSGTTPTPHPTCPDVGGTWVDVATDANSTTRTFSDAGQYRLIVEEPGGCFERYYFNVFKGTVNPTIVTEDIICSTDGSITINNVPAGYEYAVVPAGDPAPGAGAYQTSNIFPISTAGNYDVYIRNVAISCVFPYPDQSVGIVGIDVDVTTTPILCAGDTGEIDVQINSPTSGQFIYNITSGGSVVSSFGPTTDRSRTFPITTSGTYTVEITSTTSSCSYSETLPAITVPPALNLNATNSKNIDCSNGVIDLSASGGTPGASGYTYALWSYTPATGATKAAISYSAVTDIPATYNATTFEGFTTSTTYNIPTGSEGTYEFIVVDDNNCTQTSSPVTIILEEPLQFSETHTDATCSGNTDGTITINTESPPGLLAYSLEYSNDGGTTYQASSSFTALAPGDYTITIRATKGRSVCSYTVGPINIANPSSPTSSASLTQDSTCTQPNGIITFTTATGGSGSGYQYSVDNGVTWQFSNVFNNITPGTYNLQVRDSNGCSNPVLPAIVVDPHPVIPDFTNTIDYNCDGTATVTLIAPATPSLTYTYSIDGGTPQASNVFTNVNPAAHTFTVRADRACPRDFIINVLQNQQFNGSIVSSTNSECNSSNNGSITIQANNFNGGSYEYSIDGGASWSSTGDNPFRIVGVAAGTHNVRIRETSGTIICELDLGDVTITEPTPLNVTGTITTSPDCNGGTATIDVQGSGGTPPYEYSIDNGTTWQTSTVFSGLAPGTYTVNIRDGNNCTECGCSTDPFTNGSFESVPSGITTFRIFDENQLDGWDSTASNNRVEIWRDGNQGVPASDGDYFAELNADEASALYQEFCTIPGDIINWSLDHRGRSGTDVAEVRIGGDLVTANFTQTMSDGNTTWGTYSGSYTVPVGQTTTVISFVAISTASGRLSIGNFIDNVRMTVNAVGCVPFEVDIPTPSNPTHVATPTVCYNGSNGEISVTASGGSGSDYNFSIDNGASWSVPSPASSTFVFTGLTPGSYEVLVRDGFGCVSLASTEVINPVLTATVATSPVTCNDGSVTITASGGNNSYEYSVVTSGGATNYVSSNTFPITTGGSYDISVRDGLGCIYNETITVGSVANPSVVVTPTQPSCSGDSGAINISISDGVADYTVTVTSTGTAIATATSSDVIRNYTGLSDGDYEFVITDGNGCSSAPVSVTIAAPTALTSTASLTQNYTCVQNGQITFTGAMGGTPPYSYGVNGVYSSDLVYNNLTEGTYVLTVRDDNGCEISLPNIVIDPLPALPTFSSSVSYECNGDGNISITPVDPSYTYTLGGTTNSTGVFPGLTNGNYTITVDYGRACTTDVIVTVLDNQELLGSVSKLTDAVCNGDTNGSIEISASNFGSSFEFSTDGGTSWSAPVSTSPVVVNTLGSGSYDVRIRTTVNGTQCDISLGSVTITEPAPVVASGSITQDPTCNPAVGATITPSATGGTGPYTYQLDSTGAFQSGPFTDVAVGSHTIIAMDSNGCLSPASAPINVVAPSNPTHVATPTVCYNGSNGEISVTASGGSGSDYNFSIDNGASWSVPSPASSTFVFTGLIPGSYEVLVRDGFGCVSLASTEVINPVLTATVATSPVTCNDGSVTITASGGNNSYEYSVVTSGGATNYVSSNTFPITTGGSYDVSVRDGLGCIYNETITVGSIVNPSVVVTPTQPSCSGDSGAINISISDGVADYTVTVTSTGTAIATATSSDVIRNYTGLSDGDYEFVITDGNGCSSAPVSVTIAAPTALTSTASLTQNYTCVQNGQITFTGAMGGTSPYSYGVNGVYSSDLVYNNLTEGTYVLTVRDDNGCEISLPNIVIDPLPALPTFSSSVSYECNGDGNISITPVDPSYTYTLGGTTNSTGVFPGLTNGNYTITVDYGRACTTDVIVTVLDNQELLGSVSKLTDAVCNGDTNASIEISASNFGSSFEFSTDGGTSWSAPVSTSPVVVNTLGAGNYDVRIRTTVNGTQCDISLGSVTITEPAPVVASGSITQDPTCNPAVGATITPSATGGTGPYTYQLDSTGAFQSGPFTDVAVGSHTIIAMDSNGCLSPASAPINVVAPSNPTHVATPTVCYNGSNGEISVTASGGSGSDYNFSIDNGASWSVPSPASSTFVFTGLTPGSYEVLVRDGFGCVSLASTEVINPVLTATVATSPVTCNDGSVTITASGGNNSYEYSVVTSGGATNYVSSNTFPITTGGSYDISVRDGLGCIYNETITVGSVANPSVVVTPTQPSCSGDSGAINISISDGVADYTVTVTSTGTAIATATSSDVIRNYTGLSDGDYEFVITDGNGCSSAPVSVTIAAPTALTSTASLTQNYTCVQNGQITFTGAMGGTPPYSYGVNGVYSSDLVYNNLTEGTYVLTVRDDNGCEISLPNIVIDPLPALPTFSSSVSYECNGDGNISITPVDPSYTYTLGGTTNSTGVFPGLTNGNYTITVDYGRACTTDVIVTVLDNQELLGSVSKLTDAVCNGDTNGSIEISASNFGSSFEFSTDGGTSWSAPVSTSPVVVNTLGAGNYDVRIRTTVNGTQCDISLGSVTITEPAPVVASGSITQDPTCNPAVGATITPSATGGTGPYTYQLDSTGAFQSGPFTDVAVGSHTIIAMDSNGCLSPASAPINVVAPSNPTHVATPTVCYNGSNGEISVTASGGSGSDYNFSIDNGASWSVPSPASSTFVFTGLIPGSYEVLVRDGFGCVSLASTEVINPVLTATVATSPVTCNDGSVTITASGGNNSYEYSVVTSGGATNYVSSNTFPITTGGSYDVSVRDGLGCIYNETITVGSIVNPSVVVTPTQPSCSGDSGAINISISDGVADYTVTVTSTGTAIATATSSDVIRNYTGLSDGDYEFVITDGNGCSSAPVSVTIAAPTALISTASLTQNYTCVQNGQITFTGAMGGTSPYSYGVNGVYSSDLVYNNLTEGTYVLTVRDDNGCEISLPNIVIDPLPALPTFSSSVSYECNGDGNISITPVDPSYTYTLGGTTNSTGVFPGLTNGNYTITVDYGRACTTDVIVTVLDNQELLGSVSKLTDAVCNGDTNASIEISASNFGSSFEFSTDGGTSWSAPVSTSPVVVNTLGAGNYDVRIRTTVNGTQCDISLGSVTITEPAPVVASGSITQDPTCNPAVGATITPSATGGTGPYTYQLDSTGAFQSGPFTDVAVGSHTIIAMDSNGCLSPASAPINVVGPATVVFTATPTACFDGTNGEIVVNVTSGNGDYQYILNGGAPQTPGTSTFTFTGLGAGSYTIDVVDGRGCTNTQLVRVINEQLTASVDIIDASCNDGSITVNALGGTGAGTYVYSVTLANAGTPADATFSNTNPIALSGNTYDVYVRDNNGNSGYCEFLLEDVIVNTLTNVSISLTDTQPTCNGDTGSIEVVISDGLSPHDLSITDGSTTTNVNDFTGTNYTFNSLPAGNYTVSITDDLGCTDTASVTLTDPPVLTANIDPILPACGTPFVGNESLFGFEFSGFPSVAPYTLEFSSDNGATWQTSPTFTGINQGTIVNPVIRIVDGATVRCLTTFPPYTIPFNVEGLIVDPVANPATCAGGFSVTVEAINGAPPFEFAIDDPTVWFPADASGSPDPTRTRTFSGLTPGLTYTFYVRDASGCIEENNEDVYDTFTPGVLLVGTATSDDCAGGPPDTGSITFTITNTSGDLSDPFDYTLYRRDDVTNAGVAVPGFTGITQNGFADITVSGLGEGRYYIETTSSPSGCMFGSEDVQIIEGVPISGDLTVVNDITCDTPGVVRIDNVVGGFPPYTFTLGTVTNATATLSGNTVEVAFADVTTITSPVDVSVIITDSNGNSCTTTLGPETLTVSQPPVLEVADVTSSTCSTDKSITITTANGVQTIGGTAPYQYSIDGGTTYSAPTSDTSFTESGLAPGNYNVIIRDANGCTSTTVPVTLYEELDFNLAIQQNLNCTPGEAIIRITVASGVDLGATGNFTYTINGVAPTADPALTSGTISGTDTFEDHIVTTDGTYEVVVTDVPSGCSVTRRITVNPVILPDFTALAIDNGNCNGSNEGIIEMVAVDNGLLPLSYEINGTLTAGGTFTATTTTTQFTGLAPGDYVVTATGTNGCTSNSATITITELPVVNFTTAPVVTGFGCTTDNNTDSAVVTVNASDVSGGSGNYVRVEFVYDNGTAATGDDITQDGTSFSFTTSNVLGGNVSITVFDDEGCSANTTAFIPAFQCVNK